MITRILPLVALWAVAVAIVAGQATTTTPGPQNRTRPAPSAGGSGAPASPRAAAPALEATALVDAAFLKQYCITCHNERAKQGGLAIDTFVAAPVGAHAEEWEKVVRKIRTGMMPPSGAPRPARAVLDAFAAS